jgi:predicted nucleic acid-binding protein
LIVVDASVLAPAIADDGADGDRARARMAGETLAAPDLIFLEVASVLRRATRANRLDARRAGQALADLSALPLRSAPHLPLLARAWELRDNASIYDGAYLALAELLRAPLLTADKRLQAVPGTRCTVELVA